MKYILLLVTIFSSLQLNGNIDGAYIGCGFGGDLIWAQQQGRSTGSYDPGFIDANYSNTWDTELLDRALLGSVFGGYMSHWGPLYLGIEGFLQFNNSSLKNRDDGFIGFAAAAEFNLDSKAKSEIRTFQYGLDFRPGWAFSNQTLLYARIGIARVHIKQKILDTNFGGALGDVWAVSFSETKNHFKSVFRVGGGIEQSLSGRLSLRTDYVYSDYGSIALRGQTNGLSANGFPVDSAFSVKEHIYSHAFTLALAYYFCPHFSLLDTNSCIAQPFCGLYVGGGAGGSFCIKSQTGEGEGLHVANPVEKKTEASSYLKQTPFQGQIFFGYGHRLGLLYLGGELFAQGLTTEKKESFDQTDYRDDPNNNAFEITINNNFRLSPFQFGFDLRPGLFLTPSTLFYSRAGAMLARIRVESDISIRGEIPLAPETWALDAARSKKKTRAGLHVGVGLEQQLSSYIHLRMDYGFTNFRKIELEGFNTGQSSLGNPTSLSNQVSSDITCHSLQLGLSWHFG